MTGINYLADYLEMHVKWCLENPGEDWWFIPRGARNQIRIKPDRILACKDKEEFRSLLETELAIAKLIG